MDECIKILLCEDQSIVAEGLKNSLNKEKDIKVMKIVSDALDIPASLSQEPFDMVITDIITENKHNVLDLLPQIHRDYPPMKIIVITGYPDVAFMEKAKKAGANSFVYKNVPLKELVNLIRSTAKGYGTFPNPEVTNALILESLTAAEMKVLRLFCAGNDRTEIAKILSISISSVKNHISSILEKTGFSTLAKLGIYVVKEGLILPE